VSTPKKFIQDQVSSLRNTVTSTTTVLGQLQKNVEKGDLHEETFRRSLAALQGDMETMSNGLTHIEEILTRIDD
jgi:Mg2+ and Co2+ transporter CorA